MVTTSMTIGNNYYDIVFYQYNESGKKKNSTFKTIISKYIIFDL